MSAERTKILEMLSEGRLTVEEAARLLDAVAASDGTEDDEKSDRDRGRSRSRRRRGRRRRWGADWEDFDVDLGDFEEEIQDRIAQARETLRASVPRIRKAVDEAMPDVDRAVREATEAMPDIGQIVKEAIRSAGEAITNRSRRWRDDDFPHSAEREHTDAAPLAPGDRLAVRNKMGHLRIETWDRSELELQADITVAARDEGLAEAFLGQVAVRLDREPGVTRVQPTYPDRDGEWEGVGQARVDLRLKVPQRVDLDLDTAHGDIRIPDIEGAAVLKCRHGHTSVQSITGDVRLDQAHGNVSVDSAGSELNLEAQHGNVSVGSVAGVSNLNVQHGNLEAGSLGAAAEIAIAHGNLDLKAAVGKVGVVSRHGKVAVSSIAGDLNAKAAHGALEIRSVSGNVRAVNRHAAIHVAEVAGDLVAENGHGGIAAEQIAGAVTAATRHADLTFSEIAGSVTVETSHGAIGLKEIAGPIRASNGRGDIRIERMGDSATVENRQGRTWIDPCGPLQSDCIVQAAGPVELVLADGSDADVAGHARQGRVRSEWPLDVTDDGHGGQVVKGRVGEGGSRVAIETTRGDIVLHRGVARGTEQQA